MPHITCAICGNGFEAKRSTAKYCSDRCRQRAKRTSSAGDDDAYSSELVAVVRKDLEKFKALDSVEGQLAIELAVKIATPGMTGVAGLSQELLRVRGQIRQAAKPPAPSGPTAKDMVAEARKKREQKTRQAKARRA